MAITAKEITRVRLRKPDLPLSVTDDVIQIYLEDSEVEFEHFGIDIDDSGYEHMLTLYALHLMTANDLIKNVASESVKDVSANYVVGKSASGVSVYYDEFKRLLRRRKYPFFVMHNS